jgi:lipid A 3-O-deacylase
MKVKSFKREICIGCVLIAFLFPTRAGASSLEGGGAMAAEESGLTEAFSKGRFSFQSVAGVFFSPVFTSLFPRTAELNYTQLNLRLGRMLNDPRGGDSLWRGNFEAVFELTNSYVYKGPGNYIGGFNLLLRYNFIQPEAWAVPYLQIGAGIVYNDVYKDLDQRAIGQAIEFMLSLSLGSRFFLSNRWSIDVEAIYQHISNAGMDERNRGNNATGGLIGLTYYF